MSKALNINKIVINQCLEFGVPRVPRVKNFKPNNRIKTRHFLNFFKNGLFLISLKLFYFVKIPFF